jgi:hypothetical protein
VIPASLLLNDSAMPDILLAVAHDVKAVREEIDQAMQRKE